MAWNDLTIPQRSQLMNMFRRNGVPSLAEMRRLYDLSSPLVETPQSTLNNAAPVYANGGPKKPYIYYEDNADFVGPKTPNSFYAGPPTIALASFNAGPGKVNEAITKARAAGIDTDRSFGWLNYLKPETQDYVNFGLRGKDIPGTSKTQENYQKVLDSLGVEYARGGNLFGPGGKKNSGLRRIIGKFAEKRTNGLINNSDVDTIIQHPEDYMSYLYDKDSLDEMRKKLYAEYYPMGYFAKEGIAAASDIMQGKESKKDVKAFRDMMLREINNNNIGSEQLRDSYFAEWLGIPKEDRRYPNALKLSEYIPSVGRFENIPFYSPSENVVPNKKQQYVNSYYAAKQLYNNEYTPEYLKPKKGNGDNYVIDPYTYLYFNNVPETKKEWKNFPLLMAEAKATDQVMNGLASFTVGSGIDPKKGQYISIFDKWDVNPFDPSASRMDGLVGKVSKLANIPQNFDASGGIGKPFYIYDRVYLDDYYGASSKPEEGTYYGGWLPEVEISATKELKHGGKIHIKKKNRGKFTALKKRTGKSASWFKAHGTPAQKKMAVFALNARKWKHSHGGIIF